MLLSIIENWVWIVLQCSNLGTFDQGKEMDNNFVEDHEFKDIMNIEMSGHKVNVDHSSDVGWSS